MDFDYLLWYVVLLRTGASQIRRNESAMQYDEILETVITELTERGYKQQRSENPEVNELALRRVELSQRIQECVLPLSQGTQDTLEEYHTAMDILSGTVSSNVNPYAADYDDINALKQIADRNRLAILLVHHLRKTADNDPLNMISGTTGIAGGADSSFILQKEKRTENTATLICTGRDIESRELFLAFSRETFLWELLQPVETEELKIPEEIILLSDFIKSASAFTGTATELAERLKLFSGTEYPPAVLKKKIIKHMDFLQKNKIAYSDKRSFERRAFTLRYDGNDGMTAGNAPANLPSLPSQPSGAEESPHVAPCLPLCGLLQGRVAGFTHGAD